MVEEQEWESDSTSRELTALEGVRLGKCRVQRLLGTGGMGIVYLAWHEDLDIQVALKVPHEELSEENSRRFRREALIAARIKHPNLIGVYDAGRQAGIDYIVMDYVDGMDLRDLVRSRGALPWRKAAILIRKAALGLAAAHAGGAVHRDIKPANILIGKDREVRVADLGLAQIKGAKGLDASGANRIEGTPAFMALEQLLGETSRIGPPADVFGLAATLCFLIEGRGLERGSEFVQILYSARETSAAELMKGRLKGAPKQLRAIVERCFHRDPQARYADAEELASALTRLLMQHSTDRKKIAGRAKTFVAGLDRKTIFAAAGALILLTLAFVFWGGDSSPREDTPSQETERPRREEAIQRRDSPKPSSAAEGEGGPDLAALLGQDPIGAFLAASKGEGDPSLLMRARELSSRELSRLILATDLGRDRLLGAADETMSWQAEDPRIEGLRWNDVEAESTGHGGFRLATASIPEGFVRDGFAARLGDKWLPFEVESFSVDRLAPEILISQPAASARVGPDFELQGEIEDAHEVRLEIDDKPVRVDRFGRFAHNVRGRANGEHSVALRAEDAAGNTKELAYSVVVDGEGPTFHFDDLVAEDGRLEVFVGADTQFKLKGRLTDEATPLRLLIDDQTPIRVRSDGSFETRLDASRSRVELYAYDDLDNVSPPVLIEVHVDAQGPALEYETRDHWDPLVGSKVVVLSGSWKDDSGLASLRSKARGPRPGLDAAISEDRYRLEVPVEVGEIFSLDLVATDGFGNESTYSFNIRSRGNAGSVADWAKPIGKEQGPLTGLPRRVRTLCKAKIDMILVEPASFERYGDVAENPHTVHLTRAYYLASHELTQAQWDTAMKDDPSSFKKSGAERKRFPVEGVRRQMAVTFLEHSGLRFPTEAEWELACRCGGPRNGHWALSDPERCNVDKAHPASIAIGSYPPNAWGFYDMVGNVSEWVEDRLDHNFFTRCIPEVWNPCDRRGHGKFLIKGGSWTQKVKYSRSQCPPELDRGQRKLRRPASRPRRQLSSLALAMRRSSSAQPQARVKPLPPCP